MSRYEDTLEVRASVYEESESFTVYVCDDCGSLVYFQMTHDAWHQRNDRAEQ